MDTLGKKVIEEFGENVFNMKMMRNYLSEGTFESLSATIRAGDTLDSEIADDVAEAMKTWALEMGATHFTHWFQPLTGATAEKHESFLVPNHDGGALMKFSGKELIQGEPDASSFPSGGLRETFEARGYTAWDPTSPAFIKECANGGVLCIPTVFCGYKGEALDKKTPLLRSMDALSKQLCRLGNLFGIDNKGKRAYATLGAEQEYFLVDKKLVSRRLDLIQTGRTLFGCSPAKHQQMEDHYFGAIKLRVMEFMTDLDHELWRMGIPAKTRHNEVAPAQFELAPVFEELNLAVDHNMIVMEVLQSVADKHGFVCLLHEKPFAGVNGSGKHNNWAVCGPDGKNWLSPGKNPHENAKFLTMICALIQAVDDHSELLRASVASAGNDHRLGANEAPPAIMSVYLGHDLTEIIKQIENGVKGSSRKGDSIELGVSSLPLLPRHTTDRNRTSPLAFTGNKFEFRAVGSKQSCAGPNVVMNTIMAEALDTICTRLEKQMAEDGNLADVLPGVLQGIVKKHKRILFDGDNYTDDWVTEAKARGLANLPVTPEALKPLQTEKIRNLFSKYGVLSEAELESRYEVYMEQYEKQIAIEAKTAVHMAKTIIMPAAIRYQLQLSETIINLEKCNISASGNKELLTVISSELDNLVKGIDVLERSIDLDGINKLSAMEKMRDAADSLEKMIPNDIWPLPSYAEMLFMV
ncbi:glutamine synthetase III [Chitinispirillales bacterium ANBcel5]|uniref:glutamine synthetase III family protein n=1 Tax=Cellulosispirillum alkaliphilum TaxID=3039283 RepID=UPI002A4F5E53|nr:glutamine synthetase III [Chitinispirillales bacterium ANBcel5]